MYILLLSIAAAAFVAYSVIAVICFVGTETGHRVLPFSALLWAGIAASSALLSIGAFLGIRLLKRGSR